MFTTFANPPESYFLSQNSSSVRKDDQFCGLFHMLPPPTMDPHHGTLDTPRCSTEKSGWNRAADVWQKVAHVLRGGEVWNLMAGFVYFAAETTRVIWKCPFSQVSIWMISNHPKFLYDLEMLGSPFFCFSSFFSRTAGEKDGVQGIAKRTAFVTLATEDYSQGALVLTARWHKIKLEHLDETWLKLETLT